MDVLRERQVKDSLERQLQDEQKVRGKYPASDTSPANVIYSYYNYCGIICIGIGSVSLKKL